MSPKYIRFLCGEPQQNITFLCGEPQQNFTFLCGEPQPNTRFICGEPHQNNIFICGKPLFAHFSYRRSMLTKLPSALSSRLTAYKIYPWSWADDEREQNKKSVTRKDICINIWLARVKVYLVHCIFQFNPWRIYYTKLFPWCIQISFQSKKNNNENQFEDH